MWQEYFNLRERDKNGRLLYLSREVNLNLTNHVEPECLSYSSEAERARQYRKKYPDRVRKAKKKWLKTDKGKALRRRHNNKRRGYGDIEIMNNVFKNIVEINWHHINNSFVIPIPKKIHRSASSYSQNKHRLSIENHWIYKFLNIDKLIKEF